MSYMDMTIEELDAFIDKWESELNKVHAANSAVYNAADPKPDGGPKSTWTATAHEHYNGIQSEVSKAKSARTRLQKKESATE